MVLKPDTKNRATGQFHETECKVRAKEGRLTNDSGLEIKGTPEEADGKAQEIIVQAVKALERPRRRQ